MSNQHASKTHNQSNSQDKNGTTADPFGLNQFSQFYLTQFNHLSELSQTFLDPSDKNSSPIDTNIKMWQESVDYFSKFLMPTATAQFNNAANSETNTANGANFKHKTTDTKSSQMLSEPNDASSIFNNTNEGFKIFEQMANQFKSDNSNPQLQQLTEGFEKLSQTFINETLKRVTQKNETSQSLFFDVLDEWQYFISTALQTSPVSLIEEQTNLCQQQLKLCQNFLLNVSGSNTEPVVKPEKGDKRFKDEDWSNNPVFDYLKQSYLLSVNSMMHTIESAEGIDDKTRQRLSFFTRQWLNAVAPTNFLWSNPEVLKITKEQGGKNLVNGLKQLAEDMEKSAHMLNISMTDSKAFELGQNIATTPGKVVFRNRMFELIQYTPTTTKVNKRPLLIVPPWINKFYIVDLKEKNSFVRWALNQGQSVFIISWVNPNQTYKNVGMETYMHEGLLTALDVIENITGEPDANIIGYCIGGMLLALTLSWLTENNQAKRVASATFWATMFDFSDPGDLGVFIDERIVSALEQEGAEKGVFDGRMMGVAFSLLRENSLYWNYYIQNYLKGERPTPFDLLYWNSDCTNVTAKLHRFILRELYLGNKLREKGELEFDGIKIDLSKVTIPVYVVATLQDHIVKWRSSYESTQLFGGEVTFVLGESGHVAGIINPPTGKYGFYTHDKNNLSPDKWFEYAEKQDSSWWIHWQQWVEKFSAGKVAKRQPGVNHQGETWEVLCDAPGNYVRVRAEEALIASNA